MSGLRKAANLLLHKNPIYIESVSNQHSPLLLTGSVVSPSSFYQWNLLLNSVSIFGFENNIAAHKT
jgi:hypothetical protein